MLKQVSSEALLFPFKLVIPFLCHWYLLLILSFLCLSKASPSYHLKAHLPLEAVDSAATSSHYLSPGFPRHLVHFPLIKMDFLIGVFEQNLCLLNKETYCRYSNT